MTTFDILFILNFVVGEALVIFTHVSSLLIVALPVVTFLFMVFMAFYKWNPKHTARRGRTTKNRPAPMD